MRALIVEDDARIADLVATALSAAGFRTETVADGDTVPVPTAERISTFPMEQPFR